MWGLNSSQNIMVPECQPTNALVFGGANPVFARTAGQISAQNVAYVFCCFQNITTHLLIHLAEQRKKYGPLHSTW